MRWKQKPRRRRLTDFQRFILRQSVTEFMRTGRVAPAMATALELEHVLGISIPWPPPDDAGRDTETEKDLGVEISARVGRARHDLAFDHAEIEGEPASLLLRERLAADDDNTIVDLDPARPRRKISS
jgi:hypothetical protein